MSELALLIAKFGLPTVFGAAALYIVLRGEFQFRYPRTSEIPDQDDKKLEG